MQVENSTGTKGSDVAAKLMCSIAYLILTALTLLLFISSFQAQLSQKLFLLVVLQTLLLVGLIYESAREWFNFSQETPRSFSFERADLKNFAAVIAGALLTYIINVNLNQGPVIAAGLVGVVAALVVPKYGVAAYCGSFVGMACPLYLTTYFPVLFAGFTAGIIFILSKPFFIGFGGKLGTIAFAGCLLTGFAMQSPLQSGTVPSWDVGRLILLYSILGAVSTYVLSIPLKYGPVLASGIVGLCGGILLPGIYGANGNIFAIVVICSSFAGMSSEERFSNVYMMIIAGIFAGLVFMFSMPYLGGAGGKLGTIAFGSVIALKGMVNIVALAKRKLAVSVRDPLY